MNNKYEEKRKRAGVIAHPSASVFGGSILLPEVLLDKSFQKHEQKNDPKGHGKSSSYCISQNRETCR